MALPVLLAIRARVRCSAALGTATMPCASDC